MGFAGILRARFDIARGADEPIKDGADWLLSVCWLLHPPRQKLQELNAIDQDTCQTNVLDALLDEHR